MSGPGARKGTKLSKKSITSLIKSILKLSKRKAKQPGSWVRVLYRAYN